MENMNELIEKGIELSEKRTWLEKGYRELLEKINAKLSEIPDMDEGSISYLLREYDYSPNQYETYKRKIRVKLVFKSDAYLELEISKETRDVWEKEIITEPSIETIRAFAGKISEIFEFFLAEIKKRNEDNQKALDIIGNLIEKF